MDYSLSMASGSSIPIPTSTIDGLMLRAASCTKAFSPGKRKVCLMAPLRFVRMRRRPTPYSKNLLLSKQAQINTKPQLEIRNNDVRCFHGATIGQIDPDAMFYLKSRGIDEDEAKRILVRGFAAEIIHGIRVPALRDQLERLLADWLRGRRVPRRFGMSGCECKPDRVQLSIDGGPDAKTVDVLEAS